MPAQADFIVAPPVHHDAARPTVVAVPSPIPSARAPDQGAPRIRHTSRPPAVELALSATSPPPAIEASREAPALVRARPIAPESRTSGTPHDIAPQFAEPPRPAPAPNLAISLRDVPQAKPALPAANPRPRQRTEGATREQTKLWIGALEVKVTPPPAPAARHAAAPSPARARNGRAASERIARPFSGFGLRQS
jgi:hypothetical protein